MITIESKEAKLSHRGKLYFFKEDDIYGPPDIDRCGSTYFELEWAPNLDGKQLLCPPRVKDEGFDFGFTINPDCTYWLTTRRMNRKYRKQISTLTFVLPKAAAAAPYLTIEFKKDDVSFDVAMNQLAVSATLILYNRFRLRYNRLKALGSKMEDESFKDIKHYGIAFSGSRALFYVARPQLSFESTGDADTVWRGCELDQFDDCDASEWQDVITVQRRINEIHNWGMGEFSWQFVLDVKGIFRAGPGGDRISFLPAEMEALGQ